VQDKWLDGGSSEPLPVISEESVEKKLKGLSVRKASWPYDPNIKVLKMFAKNFAIPLTNIFNEPFRSRIFSKIWKRYNVCAIPKVTPCCAVEDLRQISTVAHKCKTQYTLPKHNTHDKNTIHTIKTQYTKPKHNTLNQNTIH
jgi:hypothetical protein